MAIEVRYEIRQSVSNVRSTRLDVVYESTSRRMTEFEYDRLKEEFPDEYFEWIEIHYQETCLAHNGKRPEEER